MKTAPAHPTPDSPLHSTFAPFSLPADDRGPDTVNRLILEGVAHHRRDAVFLHWRTPRRPSTFRDVDAGDNAGDDGVGDGVGDVPGWQATPDWRAERESLRVALTLRIHLGLEKGDRVALWLPLSPEFMIIERAVWMFGGITLPLDPTAACEDISTPLRETQPKVIVLPDVAALECLHAAGSVAKSIRTAITVAARGDPGRGLVSVLDYAQVMEIGESLGGPEQTSRLREEALTVAPTAPLTLGCRSGAPTACVLFNHRSMLSLIRDLADENPPSRQVRFVKEIRPLRSVRARVYASWADGVSTVAFLA